MSVMSSSHSRMPLIDALKALASQTIVLHHLAIYGPLGAGLALALPDIQAWLSEFGRMAVQVFLVIGGFLAARSLSPNGGALRDAPFGLIARRYVRLVVPFLVAIGVAIVASAIADHWMDDDVVPGRATFRQWLAHATLLHSLLGVESLSAGVWYVAIDFQLFALFALLLWIARRARWVAVLVGGLTLASLFHFNRDAGWDNWALYFFGAYGLGIAAWWASAPQRLRLWLGLLTSITVAALVIDFRGRIALALAVALLLAFSRRNGLLERWPAWGSLMALGQISYSVFLIHFPVLLLANGLFVLGDGESAQAAVVVLLLTWLASTVAGAGFYRWVESPAANRRITGAFGGLTQGMWRTLLMLLRGARRMARRAFSTAD